MAINRQRVLSILKGQRGSPFDPLKFRILSCKNVKFFYKRYFTIVFVSSSRSSFIILIHSCIVMEELGGNLPQNTLQASIRRYLENVCFLWTESITKINTAESNFPSKSYFTSTYLEVIVKLQVIISPHYEILKTLKRNSSELDVREFFYKERLGEDSLIN